jgi:MoaA/NifB/PqqE/SkfB family radical SAM enzyme
MLNNILFGTRLLVSNFKRLRFPYKLNMAITYKCNSRCMTCNIWRKEPEDELSLAEIETFFSRNNRFSSVSLTGGEIFLHKDIQSVFQVVLDNCPRLAILQFPTNGLLTKKIEKTIGSIPLTQRSIITATVSLDGPPRLHDQIRGIPGSSERSLETFRVMREELGIRAFLGTTLSVYNQGKLMETYRSVKAKLPWIEPDDFHINIAHTSTHFYANQRMPVFDSGTVQKELVRYAELRSTGTHLASLVERKYAILGQKYLTTSRNPLVCKALGVSCFTDPQGNVYPCITYNRAVGNIRLSGYRLEPIWRSPDTVEVYNQIQQGKCPQCWTPCEAFPAMGGSLFRKELWTSVSEERAQ